MSQISPDRVLQVLSRHIGEENGVTVTKLAQEIADSMLVSAGDERAVRAAVVELRKAGLHVCAHPGSGYYMARDEAELVRCCKYLFDRAMCSLEQVAAMRRESLPDLRGQMRLPT